MNRKEAEAMGLLLLVAVKNAPQEELEVILGEIREIETKKTEQRLGFKPKPKDAENNYSI